MTPELRQIVAKVARSEVKSYLQERQETATGQDPRGECVASHCVENGHMYIYPQESE